MPTPNEMLKIDQNQAEPDELVNITFGEEGYPLIGAWKGERRSVSKVIAKVYVESGVAMYTPTVVLESDRELLAERAARDAAQRQAEQAQRRNVAVST